VSREEEQSRQAGSANGQAIAQTARELDERGTVKWDVPITDARSLATWKANLPNRQ
jgi:hypothetical protein